MAIRVIKKSLWQTLKTRIKKSLVPSNDGWIIPEGAFIQMNGDVVISGNVTIEGDLTISGTLTVTEIK